MAGRNIDIFPTEAVPYFKEYSGDSGDDATDSRTILGIPEPSPTPPEILSPVSFFESVVVVVFRLKLFLIFRNILAILWTKPSILVRF